MTKIYKSANLKKHLFIFICALLFSNVIYCQTSKIKVTVLDAKTLETVPFANVALFQNEKQIANMTSDIDGNAIFKDLNVGTFSVKTTYLGFESCTINKVQTQTNKTTYLDVNLNSSIIELKECVIVSYTFPLISRTSCCRCCFTCCGMRTEEDIENNLIETITTDVDTIKAENVSFKIYPNPTVDKVILELDGKINEVFITDISGKQIEKITSTNQSKLEIDMGNLTRGVYLLQFNNNGKQESTKVVLTN